MSKKLFVSVLVSLLSLAIVAEAAPGDRRGDGRGGGRWDRDRDHRRPPTPPPPPRPIERNERLVIEMGDRHYVGRDNIIYLKQEIMRNYPHMNVQNMELDGVRLVAKSQRGMGTAELMVGPTSKDRKTVAGNPADFHRNLPYTYDRIELDNYGSSFGPWQILLDGNIKVKRVVIFVTVDRRGGYNPPPRVRLKYMNAGETKYDKIIYNRKSFTVNQNGVEEVSIQGEDKSLHIKQVIVHFGNGRSRVLNELSGNLYEGQIRTAFIESGRFVTEIEVEATSLDLFGGRGALSVEVGYR